MVGISFVYVFLFAFAFVWTPMQALYPSEVLAYNARAKGLGMSGLWLNIVSFVNTVSQRKASIPCENSQINAVHSMLHQLV